MLRLSEITIKHPSLWEGLVRLLLGFRRTLSLPPQSLKEGDLQVLKCRV